MSRGRQRSMRYRPAFDFDPAGGAAPPFGNLPTFGGVPVGVPVLIDEDWSGYGDVVIEDSAAANLLWEAAEIATCGPQANATGGFVKNGIVSAGTASFIRRQTTPNIDYSRYHSIETDYIRVNNDGCDGSIGMEAAAAISRGQVYLRVRQVGADKELYVAAPGVASTLVETFASAAGGSALQLKLEVFPLSGATRTVKVYRGGTLKGTYSATAGVTTNRNVSLYFDNFGTNAADRVRIGPVVVRGYTVP